MSAIWKENVCDVNERNRKANSKRENGTANTIQSRHPELFARNMFKFSICGINVFVFV